MQLPAIVECMYYFGSEAEYERVKRKVFTEMKNGQAKIFPTALEIRCRDKSTLLVGGYLLSEIDISSKGPDIIIRREMIDHIGVEPRHGIRFYMRDGAFIYVKFSKLGKKPIPMLAQMLEGIPAVNA